MDPMDNLSGGRPLQLLEALALLLCSSVLWLLPFVDFPPVNLRTRPPFNAPPPLPLQLIDQAKVRVQPTHALLQLLALSYHWC